MEGAQANVLASAKLQCDFRNNDLKTIYLTAFNNWKISVDAGRIDISNPPQPPKAFVVKTDSQGWAYVIAGDEPVCEMPALPEDHSKTQAEKEASLPQGVIDIGHSVDGGAGVWFAVGPNDTWFKSGKKTPPMPDGHVYQCVGAAVGKGWYERIG